jgi:hypothetical protein
VPRGVVSSPHGSASCRCLAVYDQAGTNNTLESPARRNYIGLKRRLDTCLQHWTYCGLYPQANMATDMFVKARCSRRREHFDIVFAKKSGTCWQAKRTFPIASDRAAGGYGSGPLDGVRLDRSIWVAHTARIRAFSSAAIALTLNCQTDFRSFPQDEVGLENSTEDVFYLPGSSFFSISRIMRDGATFKTCASFTTVRTVGLLTPRSTRLM